MSLGGVIYPTPLHKTCSDLLQGRFRPSREGSDPPQNVFRPTTGAFPTKQKWFQPSKKHVPTRHRADPTQQKGFRHSTNCFLTRHRGGFETEEKVLTFLKASTNPDEGWLRPSREGFRPSMQRIADTKLNSNLEYSGDCGKSLTIFQR